MPGRAWTNTWGNWEWRSSVEMSSALLAVLMILSVTQLYTCATRDGECARHWTCVTSKPERILRCSRGLVLIRVLLEVELTHSHLAPFRPTLFACQLVSGPAGHMRMRRIFTKQSLVRTEYKWNITEQREKKKTTLNVAIYLHLLPGWTGYSNMPVSKTLMQSKRNGRRRNWRYRAAPVNDGAGRRRKDWIKGRADKRRVNRKRDDEVRR